MKPHLTPKIAVVLFLLVPIFSFGQTTATVAVDSPKTALAIKSIFSLNLDKGKFISPALQAIKVDSKDALAEKGTISDASITSDDVLKRIKPKLIAAAQNTIDSLKDERTNLKKLYEGLYGAKSADTLIKQLTTMITELKLDSLPSHPSALTRSIINSISHITSPQINYQYKSHYIANKSEVEVDIYESDPLKLFIQDFVLKPCEDYPSLLLSPTFYTDKSDLQKYLVEAVDVKSDNYFHCDEHSPPGNDPIEKLNEKIENNTIFKNITSNDCIKTNFWINGGNFRIRPLDNTSSYNWPMVFKFNAIIQQKIDSLKKCCEDDPQKIEALLKATDSGIARFKRTGGILLDYKSRDEILKTNTFVNQILIPVLLKNDCCKPGYFEPYIKKWVINYDASNDYITDRPCLKPAVPDNEQVVIAVNNIPSTKTVAITSTELAITDQSKAQASLSEIGTALSGAATSIIPLGGIISGLNPINNPTSFSNFKDITPPPPPGASGGKKAKFLNVASKTYTTQLGGKPFKFPGTTNKELLYAYIEANSDETSQKLQKKGADYFLAFCFPDELHYSNKDELKNAVTELVNKFNAFIKMNVKKHQSDIAELGNNKVLLNFFLSALEEQAPYKEIKNVNTETPTYRTVLSNFDFITPPKEKDYIITEEVLKPNKTASTVKPAPEPSAADSIKTNVMKGRYKVGGLHRFQVSAGLGYTTNDYTLTSAAFANNQLTVTPKDQQFSFIVGLNTYFLREFNLDNSFMGLKNKTNFRCRFWSRFSLYTGVGIPDPTHNFYGGLSADLLPGVKITGGYHYIVYTNYQITNNNLDDQSSSFIKAGPFVAFNLDASFIGSLFGLFK